MLANVVMKSSNTLMLPLSKCPSYSSTPLSKKHAQGLLAVVDVLVSAGRYIL